MLYLQQLDLYSMQISLLHAVLIFSLQGLFKMRLNQNKFRDVLAQFRGSNNTNSSSFYWQVILHEIMMKRHLQIPSSRPTWRINNYVIFKNSYLPNDNSESEDFRCIRIVSLSTIILVHHISCLLLGCVRKLIGCQNPTLGFQAHKLPLWHFVLQTSNPWAWSTSQDTQFNTNHLMPLALQRLWLWPLQGHHVNN